MYNIHEKPTVEVEFKNSYNSTFLSNILKIVEETESKSVIVSKWADTFDQEILSWFLKKICAICSDVNVDVELMTNVVPSIYDGYKKFLSLDLHLEDWGEKLLLYGDLADIFILDVNLTQRISKQQWEGLSDIINERNHTQVDVLVNVSSCKNKRFNLSYYEDFLGNIGCLENRVYLTSLFKSVDLVNQHPCNAYLCSHGTCHSGKSNYPRFLCITEHGVRPYGAKNNSLIFLQDITSQKIKSFKNFYNKEYRVSQQHSEFLRLNERIYNEFILVPHYKILPWNIFLDNIDLY